MSKKVKNKNDKLFKDYITKNIGMKIQAILLIILIVLGIITIFNNSFKVACMFVMSALLVVVAYNNHKIYKRKAFTILYIVGALLAFFSGMQIMYG